MWATDSKRTSQNIGAGAGASPRTRVKMVLRKHKGEDTGAWGYGYGFVLDKRFADKENRMETYPISLAIFDFIPPLAFLAGAFFLVRIGLLCRGKSAGGMVMAGTLLVFLGGFLTATWKLLYTTGTADIQWMRQSQFVFSAFGFLGMFVAVIYMVRGHMKNKTAGAILSIAAWKLPFLLVMTVSSLGAEGILTYLAFRRKANLAAIGFVIGVLGILAMGALASAEQTLTMQWVEESVNAVGQLGFMTGSILLYRNFKATGGFGATNRGLVEATSSDCRARRW